MLGEEETQCCLEGRGKESGSERKRGKEGGRGRERKARKSEGETEKERGEEGMGSQWKRGMVGWWKGEATEGKRGHGKEDRSTKTNLLYAPRFPTVFLTYLEMPLCPL